MKIHVVLVCHYVPRLYTSVPGVVCRRSFPARSCIDFCNFFRVVFRSGISCLVSYGSIILDPCWSGDGCQALPVWFDCSVAFPSLGGSVVFPSPVSRLVSVLSSRAGASCCRRVCFPNAYPVLSVACGLIGRRWLLAFL